MRKDSLRASKRQSRPVNQDSLYKASRTKDKVLESRLFMIRAIIGSLIVLLSFFFIIANAAFLTVEKYDYYATRSENNRIKREPVAPIRGNIYDRNGRELAINLPSHRLEVVPEKIEDKELLFEFLSTAIGISVEEFEEIDELKIHRARYQGVPVKFRLSDAEIARISVDIHKYPELQIKSDLTRYYPQGSKLAHVVGYVGRVDSNDLENVDVSNYKATTHIGKIGIEKYYEDILHGSVGYRDFEVNVQGREIAEINRTESIPGQNIYLQIDIEMQEAIESSLGAFKGAAVAMNPKDGSVLGMVSNPSFNPNSFVNGISHTEFNALNTSPAKPLFNRILNGQYPPGSTIKPMLGLVGLETNTYNSSKEVYCPGHFSLPNNDHRYRDWKRSGHGSTDLRKSIVESCDVYFYNLALDLGIDQMFAELSYYGFGRQTGIDLYSEKSGLLPSKLWKKRRYDKQWYIGETVIAGIGQGYMLATPLQMAVSTAIIANDGKKPIPRLLLGVENIGDGKMAVRRPLYDIPVPIRRIENWDTIKSSMADVVTDRKGTARKIEDKLLVPVAGKTGTSQVFTLGQDQEYDADAIENRLRDHALFVSYAPLDDPEVVVVVIVENGGSGGAVAAPIAQGIINAYAELYMGIQPPDKIEDTDEARVTNILNESNHLVYRPNISKQAEDNIRIRANQLNTTYSQ